MRNKSLLVMVGAFPPPLHGMAAVNAAVFERFRDAKLKPIVIDLAAYSLGRSLIVRLSRLPRILLGFVHLLFKPTAHGGTLYMSLSGGFGQIYEILFLCLARKHKMRIFLHHHSFAYLNAPRRLTKLLIRIAELQAVHVVQSPGMAERLKTMYDVACVIPVSNAVYLVSASAIAPARKRNRLETLGFLSNVSREKGVFEFLDLFAVMRDKGMPLRGRLAGPFQDAQTEREVRERLGALPNVEYLGPQYGADKTHFYADVDALLFPTRYVNEAEPLTIHEAISAGLPVIAYGRGCIPEIVGLDCGLAVDPAAPFVPAALAQIEAWLASSTAFEDASRAAAQRFAETYATNTQRWQKLLTEIAGTRVGALVCTEAASSRR